MSLCFYLRDARPVADTLPRSASPSSAPGPTGCRFTLTRAPNESIGASIVNYDKVTCSFTLEAAFHESTARGGQDSRSATGTVLIMPLSHSFRMFPQDFDIFYVTESGATLRSN